jgi:hypothetical protein
MRKKKRTAKGGTDRRASVLSVSGARRISTARKPRHGREALPEELRPLFWEVDFNKLRWDKNREFVAGRILQNGTSITGAGCVARSATRNCATSSFVGAVAGCPAGRYGSGKRS